MKKHQSEFKSETWTPRELTALEQREDRVEYLYRKSKRNQRRTYWGLILHLGVATIALFSFAYIASQPTGDERFQAKYCTLMNGRMLADGRETSKVWNCPRVLWR
jgi:hypothetical protein